MHSGTITFPLIRRLHLTLAILATATVMLAAGCGGVSSSSHMTPGGVPPGSPALPAKAVYALNGSAGTNSAVAGFRIDGASGALTPLPGSPFGLGLPGSFAVSTMAATPVTAFIYVVDWFDKRIIVLRADPGSGTLSAATTVAVPGFQSPTQARVDPSGKFLFVGDGFAMAIFAFAIGSDGSLTAVPGSPFSTGAPVLNLTFDAGSRFLFAGGEQTVSGFTIGSNGSLTPTTGSSTTVRPPFVTPGKGPTGVTAVLDPAARFLYVVDQTSPRVFVYSIGGDGLLTQVSGSPFFSSIFGIAADVSLNGNFLFIGGFGTASVDAFTIDTTTGVLHLAPHSPFPNGTGGAPIAELIVDPSGKFVLTANEEETNISVFSIGQDGALTMVPGAPFPSAAQPIGGGSPSVVVVTR